MSIVSVNVGLPRQVVWKGKAVETGIFKEPVAGSVRLRALNLDGDKQTDLTVHGGLDKAVYCYPSEHYTYWRSELPGMELTWGMFGENLTTKDLAEDTVGIGDQFRIGSAVVMVTQPRMPCYKLGLRFGRDDIIKRFLESGRTGFYFAVMEEGELETGDSMKLIHRDPNKVTLADMTRLYAHDKYNLDLLRRAVQVEALPESWRGYFSKRIEKMSSNYEERSQRP